MVFLNNNLIKGSPNDLKNTAFIGTELAYNLKLEAGDKINLMSSFVTTPFGEFPNKRHLQLLEFLTLDFMNLIKI